MAADDGHMIDHAAAFHSRGPLLHASMMRASRVAPPLGKPDANTDMMTPFDHDPFHDGAVNEVGSDDLLGA